MKDEILQKLKELEILVLSDSMVSGESIKYHHWVDIMQGRCREMKPCCEHSYSCITDPKQYAEYQLIKSMVDDLYYKEHGDNKKYHEDKPEIRKMIAEIVAMTLFYKEQV